MRSSVGGATPILAGLLSGLLVGWCDGGVAALSARVGFGGFFASVGLASAVDLLLGGALGLLFTTVAALSRWGRRRARPPVAIGVGWAVVGFLAGAGAAAVVVATAERNDRFLAAGLVATVAVFLGVLGALVAPAVSRFLGPPLALLVRLFGPRPTATGQAATPAGLALVAPAVALAVGAAIFGLVWAAQRPGSLAGRLGLLGITGGLTAILPAALTLGATRVSWSRWRIAAPAAGALALLLLVLFVRSQWTPHLQFVPWRDLRMLGLMVLLAGALAMAITRLRPKPRAVWAILLLAPPVALALGIAAGGSDRARKATTLHGALVGPVLGWVRPMLDFDGDGYPGLLGGGDCDDADRDMNPRAVDWPQDGLDQDCDGADVDARDLLPPPLHPVPKSVPKDLNLVLIVVDALRADHLGAYGYERKTSPNLDVLAKEGILFENAWAHAPSTRDSMPAIVTGRWPSALRWDRTGPWPGILSDQPTIAQLLRRQGYFNGAFYAYAYFDRSDGRGFDRGVHQYDARLAARHVDGQAGASTSEGTSAREMADDGIDFLRIYKDKTFFLTLHFFDPHLAYERHPEAPDFGSSPQDLYDNEIWYTDKHIGRLLRAIDELELDKKTAVFVTADHGEGFGEHGVLAHGNHLYASLTKVPLLARVPGLGSRRVKEVAGHVDIAPTLLNLARGKPQPTFLGRSLVDVMSGKKDPAAAEGFVFQEVGLGPAPSGFFGSRRAERRGIVSASHHLIWHRIPENVVSCYALKDDPQEKRDLWGNAAGQPACAALKTRLDRHLSRLKLTSMPPAHVAAIVEAVRAPGQTAPRPKTKRTGTFGDRVRVVGYDAALLGAPFPSPGFAAQSGMEIPVEPDTGPQGTKVIRIARGGQMDMAIHFEVERRLEDWRLFYHLVGPRETGRKLDRKPLGGAYPIERWRPGQKLRDRFVLRFDGELIPGMHTLMVGLWRPPEATGQRLPVQPADVADDQDRMALVSFFVEP